jgi:hypothetical protein
MSVIGFLCVSLWSSTVQLHNSLGSRQASPCSETGFCSQIGNRDWEAYYRRAAICYEFFWAKGLNEKDIHKEMLPVYDGKCLSWKAIHNWVKKIISRTFKSHRWCPTMSPCWECDRSNCAAGGRFDSISQEDNYRQCSNCTRVFPWFSIQHKLN